MSNIFPKTKEGIRTDRLFRARSALWYNQDRIFLVLYSKVLTVSVLFNLWMEVLYV